MARIMAGAGQTNLDEELAIIDETREPSDTRQFQMVSCLELVAAAGRTISCAALRTGMTVEQV